MKTWVNKKTIQTFYNVSDPWIEKSLLLMAERNAKVICWQLIQSKQNFILKKEFKKLKIKIWLPYFKSVAWLGVEEMHSDLKMFWASWCPEPGPL